MTESSNDSDIVDSICTLFESWQLNDSRNRIITGILEVETNNVALSETTQPNTVNVIQESNILCISPESDSDSETESNLRITIQNRFAALQENSVSSPDASETHASDTWRTPEGLEI